jgi:hypothetical protein
MISRLQIFVALMIFILSSTLASASSTRVEVVKGTGHAYLICRGVAYRIPDGATYHALGLTCGDLRSVESLSVSQIGRMPSVKDHDVILRGIGQRVYVMRDGELRLVTSTAVFEREFGKSGWNRVKSLPEELLKLYPQGSPLI